MTEKLKTFLKKYNIHIGFAILTVLLFANVAVFGYSSYLMHNRIESNVAINERQDTDHFKLVTDTHMQLSTLDLKLQETRHDLEVLQSQVEIIDDSINGQEKRKAKMNKVIAAIKATLPEYGNPLEGCPKAPSPGELWSIAGAIVDNSEEYAVPASLIAAVIRQESAFCNQAVSPVGAKGYMQLMPETAAQVSADVAVKTGRALRTWRGRDNIQLGTAYLSEMLLEFNGDITLAAAAYNGGPTHVKRVLANLIEEQTCKNGTVTKFYCETHDYMYKVSQYKEEYDRLGLQ